ncbi:hypothetical protein [Mycobacterium sp.]|uniref:hypothetical protein n=1 Tax=Mycobacterium sp. TaxID=1785 RepID=UPI003A85BD09
MSADGKWKITIHTPLASQAGTLELATTGMALSGTATMLAGGGHPVNGTVQGENLTWQITVKRPLPMIGHFVTTVAGDELSGTAKLSLVGQATFEGSRVVADN